MIWGRQDPHVPREGRAVVYNALADAGTNFTWHEFNGQHAFLRDEGPRYDSALAMQSYALDSAAGKSPSPSLRLNNSSASP